MNPPTATLIVVVEPGALDRTAGGAVLAPLWLRIEPHTGPPVRFPEKQTIHPAAYSLALCLEGLEAVRAGVVEHASVDLTYPRWFQCTLAPFDSTTYHARCFLQTVHDQLLFGEWRVRRADFNASARESGRRVLAACEGRGWTGGDISRLRAALELGERAHAG